MGVRPAAMLWSGGRDSTLALEAVLVDPSLAVRRLVTTVSEDHDRVTMHGVRRKLVQAQADALGLPLQVVPIPAGASNEVYDDRMAALSRDLVDQGIEAMVVGDVFLEDVRGYREDRLAGTGLEGVWPIWGRDTGELARTFLEQGHRARIVCVDPGKLDPAWAGAAYDEAFLAELPEDVDPCGERGAFHTFVHAAPVFEAPIEVEVGEKVKRDGFVYADLRRS